MTRSALFGATAFALTVTAAQAAPEEFSANSILPGCKDAINEKSTHQLEQGLCMGIIRWVTQMGDAALLVLRADSRDNLDANKRLGLRSAWGTLCIDGPPHEATLGQVVRVVVAYIDARPARMHAEFGALALEALRDAWPCK